ncbi:MAG: lipid-binding SYLF domain-containing protein [Deltaproteobacteria bacterium]|nr:lipid-binding SYLF domain-containing protein [Deltaproteobacteria bacterium]
MFRVCCAFITLILILVNSNTCLALSFEEVNQRIIDCNSVMQKAIEMPDRAIPRDLLKGCRGLAIFPNVMKLGALLGVGFGSGIVLRRDEQTGQWSKPVFFSIRSGSFGPQFGAQSTDLILVVMSERGVQGLLEESFTLGADVSVAAGRIGRDASAETNLRFDSSILSYSRAKGLFAGISLTGASVKPDREANEAYHGTGVTAQDVFYEGKGALSDNARLLMETLDNATR